MKEETNNNPEEFEDFPLRGTRKIIAARLSESKSTIPHFYLVSEIDTEKIIELKKSLNETQSDVKITYNDIFIKITALTLKIHPYMASHFMGDKIRRFKNINLGFAVAVEDGLLVPVIKDCDKKSIKDIAVESKSLAEKAKIKRLRRHEYQGAVFTITNLGMYDIENFSAIINPPECAILAFGSIIKKPVVIGDQLEVGNRMKITLSCDHRVIDGTLGAEFLKSLKMNLENPDINII
ncbi:dihydrolipoamide acetyltransferase family protein [candidate division KSB1 bacterium]